ncbi:hypothetical protein GCM10011579_063770 [Streptomyces albiflavescens]|uniref:Uncharacterized protein n=1 Tax=Streptomyces albiflavescens TaxID=1623582 RepID=A0A917YB24_9ACTN|nr:hypothetical protein [Streptomyces albiflavescens]GGN79382.1 hypothetical protein GCM10011579_063770 [Streptomyces albiflavescens]
MSDGWRHAGGFAWLLAGTDRVRSTILAATIDKAVEADDLQHAALAEQLHYEVDLGPRRLRAAHFVDVDVLVVDVGPQ